MKFVLLCKRYYANKDLIVDKFGRLFYLPIELKKQGFEGIVIAVDYRNKFPTYQQIENVDFYSIPFQFFKFPVFLYQLNQIIKNYQPNVLITSGDTHFGSLGLWFSHQMNIPTIFDIYDYYPAFGTNKIPFFKSLFKLNLQKSDLIICASYQLEEMAHRYNTNTIFIPNGVDQNIFKPMNKYLLREKLNIAQHDNVIGFFGSIAKDRGFEILLEASRLLYAEMPNLKLLIAGNNNTSINLNEKWIDYRGIVNQMQVSEFINISDVVTMPYSSNALNDVMSHPCKMAEYLACDVPIVNTNVGNYPIHQGTCNPTPQSMAQALKLQLLNPQKLSFPQELSWSFLGQQLAQSMDNLLNKSL